MKRESEKFLIVIIALVISLTSCGGGGGNDNGGMYTPPENVSVSSITISSTSAEVNVGSSIQLTVTISPSNATDKTVGWSSSNSSIAEVSSSGQVSGKAEGTATIKASCGGKKASCKVTVKKSNQPIPVQTITLNATSTDLIIGNTYKLTAVISPSNATDKTIAWSTSNASVASVTQSGLVTGISEGTASISASCGYVKAVCTVNVKKNTVWVNSITLDKTSISIECEKQEKITATVKPDNATDKTIYWSSSNSQVATVDGNGIVTGKKEGSAYIIATSYYGKDNSQITAECQVNVKPKYIAVSSVSLSDSYKILDIGETYTLKATITPTNATNKTVTWKSNNSSVATVSSDGLVVALAKGVATITAVAEGKEASCIIDVTNPVSSVVLNKTVLYLNKGGSSQLAAIIEPADAADKHTITWSSNKISVASVNNGLVSGIAVGDATITASSGGKSAQCYVHVTTTQSISLSQTNVVIKEGEELTLTVYALPEGPEYNFSWQSSNTEIVTVEGNGRIRGVNTGLANVTVSNNGKSATCKVTVGKRGSLVDRINVEL